MSQGTIMFVAPTAYPLGGVAVWLDYLMQGLAANGWNVVFGAVSGHYHQHRSYLQHYPYADTVVIDNPSHTEIGRVQAIRKAVQKTAPDLVVVANIPDTYRAARELKGSSLPALKVVATIHALVPQLFDDLRTYDDVIDAVVVTNRLTQKAVTQFTCIESSHVLYAPYGVQLNGKPGQINAESTLRLLYCGRIEQHQKRCQDLIPIIQKLEASGISYELRIAGDGSYREELVHQLETITHYGRVIELGNIPADRIHEVAYAASDILLLTSSWETGPIVVWEAMASGLAVVTSRYLGLATEDSLVNEQNCLIFEVGDTAAAADQVIRLKDSTLFRKLVNGGYDLVSDRYSRRVSIDAWHSAFSKILDTPQRRGPDAVQANEYSANGRIEAICGARLAMWIRRITGRSAYVASAGDEWPHTHSRGKVFNEHEFDELIARLESGPVIAHNTDIQD